MVPATLAHPLPLMQHHPLGASTGYLREHRGDWPALIAAAIAESVFAAELAALGEDELPALVALLEEDGRPPFRYLSVHAPSKRLRLPEAQRVALLARLVPYVDAIVVHPDTIADAGLYAGLGDRLVLENMDARKTGGRTAAELAPSFEALPRARFCFDVAHAADVDPTLLEAGALLDAYGHRLAHVHVSSLDGDGHHVTLRPEDEERFAGALARCRDVPWIHEAPPPAQ